MALKLNVKEHKVEEPELSADETPQSEVVEDKDTVWIDEVMVRKESFSLDNVNSMFAKVHKYVDEMAKQADSHKVIDRASMEKAIGMGTQAKQYINKIEKTRKEVKQPYLEFGKKLDSLAKGVTKRLEAIQENLREKIRPVMLAEKERAAKAQQAAEEERKKKEATTPGFGSAEVPAPVAPPAPTDPKKVSTSSGSAEVVKKYSWELEDITKVPAEYLTIAVSKVNKDVKAGKKIPGIKVTVDEDVSMRANRS